MNRRAAALLAALSIALAACDEPTGIAFPLDAVEFVPSALYAAWWRATEQCAGAQADMARVRFYRIPRLLVSGASTSDGAYFSDGRIVLYDGVLREGTVVRHEMLHAIGARSAERFDGHPRRMFHERCGGIVTCNGDCARAAGIVTPPSPAETLQPADLERTLVLSRRETSALVDSGWVTLTVAVRNPRAHAVRVNVPTAPLGTGPPVFGARVDGYGPITAVTGFAPLRAGETRRWVLDAHLGTLPPGAYRVRGAFVRDSTAADTLMVLP